MNKKFEFPNEISKTVGQISLHFQRLEYVVFEFVAWLLGDTNEVRKEISNYNFQRLIVLMDLLIRKELSRIDSLKEDYKKVYEIVKKVQMLRNKTIHSNFIVTYRDNSFTIQYNIKEVAKKGIKSIKKIKINELISLIELTKLAIENLSNFSFRFRAISSAK